MDETARTVFVRTEAVTVPQPPVAHRVHCPPVAEPAWPYSCSYMAIGSAVTGHTATVTYDGTAQPNIRMPSRLPILRFKLIVHIVEGFLAQITEVQMDMMQIRCLVLCRQNRTMRTKRIIILFVETAKNG